jgi:serine/threonine protein kinase
VTFCRPTDVCLTRRRPIK